MGKQEMENQAVIISEDEDTAIYNYDNIQEIGSLSRYNHSMAYIIDEDSGNDYLLKFNDGKLGWANLKKSILMSQKDKQFIKLKETPIVFDRAMRPDVDLSFKLSNRLCTSSYSTLHNGEKLEAVNFRGKLTGFVKKEVYYTAIEVSEYISIKEQLPLYRDSDRKIHEFTLEPDQEVLIQIYFQELSLAKVSVTVDGQEHIGWIGAEFNFKDREAFKLNSKSFDVNIEASANVINELMDRIIKLEGEKVELREKYSKLERVYHNLKSSRLGKLQISYWNFKRGRK